MGDKRLIVNADDLGYSRGVNEAIVRCAREGLLRSATIMAGGAAFDHAVELIRDAPRLGIGVHVTLTELRPVLAAHCLSGLVTGSGALPATAKALLLLLATKRTVVDSLRRELAAQLEKVAARGIRITHVDSHKHLHVLPVILTVVLDVALQFGVRWIRNPFDDTPVFRMSRAIRRKDRGTFRSQSVKSLATRIFKATFDSRVSKAGMASPAHFFGVGLTGVWTEEAFRTLASRLPQGLSEVMFHPADCDAQMRSMRTRLLEQREVERDLLLSESIRDVIRANDISPISYGEILQ